MASRIIHTEVPKRGPKPRPKSDLLNSIRWEAQLSPELFFRLEKFFDSLPVAPSTKAEQIAYLLDVAEKRTSSTAGLRSSSLDAHRRNEPANDHRRGGGVIVQSSTRQKRSRPSEDGQPMMSVVEAFHVDEDIVNSELRVAPEIPSQNDEVSANGDYKEDGEDEWMDIEEAELPAPEPFKLKAGSGQEVKYAPPLLRKGYYKAFSFNARRSECVPGGRLTIAQASNAKKYIVEKRHLWWLIKNVRCPITSCRELLNPSTIKFQNVGYACKVTALCNGPCHDFEWATSTEIMHVDPFKEKSIFYAMNASIPAALAVVGQNFYRMSKLAKALNLQWGGKTRFFQFQRICSMEAVEKCHAITQRSIFTELKRQIDNGGRLIVAGDGQYDSPGSCGKTCCYTIAAVGFEKPGSAGPEIYHSGYIIEQTTVDRRHANNNSPQAEHVGFHTALRSLYRAQIPIAEIITDEHKVIMADLRRAEAAAAELTANLVRENSRDAQSKQKEFRRVVTSRLAEWTEEDDCGLLEYYVAIKHSIDLWHKAKNLKKKVFSLCKFADKKEAGVYHRYAQHLQNHLWWSAEHANGDEAKFRALWLSCIRHLQGDHSKCAHSELCEREDKLPDLTPGTAAFTKLVSYLQSIGDLAGRLCRFRHTGALENFHSLCLLYTPKRNDFDFDCMTLRRQVAAMDYNHNVNRAIQFHDDGSAVMSVKWSKDTRQHVPAFRREGKNYDYMGHLIAAIVYERASTTFDFRNDSAVFSEQHPRHFQPTIAGFETSREVVLDSYRSRFPWNRQTDSSDLPATSQQQPLFSNQSPDNSDVDWPSDSDYDDGSVEYL